MIELKLQVNTGFRMIAVYFKDSYKFINLPLRLLPKSFGFHNELQKGFFPHDLNTKENLSYASDHLPDVVYFGINDMTCEESNRFLSWYDEEKVKYDNDDCLVYNLHEEMIKYCYDDCFVLATAFTKFNESMIMELKSTGVQGIIDHDYTILADFITLPQMVIHWFVGCMMNEHQISVVPAGGYSSGKCGSLKECIWLAYLDKVHLQEEGDDFVPIVSRYCSGVGQHRVGDFFLDRFRELPNGGREFYEFYGCYYHGCSVCYADRSKIVRCKHREDGYITVDKARIDTIEHERLIRRLSKFDEVNDKWIVLWEHEFNERCGEFKSTLSEDVLDNMPDKLNPRDAVKGGRTEVFKMHTKVKDLCTQTIRYLDINSLYPLVMSVTEFPIEHPTIRCGHGSCIDLMKKLDRDNVQFIGVCLVRILATKCLMVPYLPHKCDGKLIFLLCKKCSLHGAVQ